MAIEDVSRMAERWYERFARLFQHEFERPKPLVLYADHPDFQQTNTLQSLLGESTGGVTESLKNRVIMPMTGSYQDTDHVLGHELVHAFQYNIAQSRQGTGIVGLSRLPLWLIEGMAEYLSVGRDDPLTAMWLRDAALRDDIPTLKKLTRDMRYFPYRFGQALWAYIGGHYGDDAVVDLFRRSLRTGWEPSLSRSWAGFRHPLGPWVDRSRKDYLPLMEGRDAPAEAGTLFCSGHRLGSQNLAPSLSPDGQRLVFMSEKDLFSFDLFLADADNGEVIETLSTPRTSPHFDALRFVDSSGSWSWDGTRLGFCGVRRWGQRDDSGGFGEGEGPGKDRRRGHRRHAGSGLVSGRTGPSSFPGPRAGSRPLPLRRGEGHTTQLTADRYADFQPTLSPDGRTIAFATDRAPSTDFEMLAYAKFQLALLDLESGEVQSSHLRPQGQAHQSPVLTRRPTSLLHLRRGWFQRHLPAPAATGQWSGSPIRDGRERYHMVRSSHDPGPGDRRDRLFRF